MHEYCSTKDRISNYIDALCTVVNTSERDTRRIPGGKKRNESIVFHCAGQSIDRENTARAIHVGEKESLQALLVLKIVSQRVLHDERQSTVHYVLVQVNRDTLQQGCPENET